MKEFEKKLETKKRQTQKINFIKQQLRLRKANNKNEFKFIKLI